MREAVPSEGCEFMRSVRPATQFDSELKTTLKDVYFLKNGMKYLRTMGQLQNVQKKINVIHYIKRQRKCI